MSELLVQSAGTYFYSFVSSKRRINFARSITSSIFWFISRIFKMIEGTMAAVGRKFFRVKLLVELEYEHEDLGKHK